MKNINLITMLIISLLVNIPLANARDHHRGYHHGNAVAAGLLGLGIGMAITAPRVYYHDYLDDDYYRRYPRHRRYWRHHPHSHYRDDDWYDYRDRD